MPEHVLSSNTDSSQEDFQKNKDSYMLVDANEINGKTFAIRNDYESESYGKTYESETIKVKDRFGNQVYVYKQDTVIGGVPFKKGDIAYAYELDGDNIKRDENGKPIVKTNSEGQPLYNTDSKVAKEQKQEVLKRDANGNLIEVGYGKQFVAGCNKAFITSIGQLPMRLALESAYDGFVGIFARDSMVHLIRGFYLYKSEQNARNSKIICDITFSLKGKTNSSEFAVMNGAADNLNPFTNNVVMHNCWVESLTLKPVYDAPVTNSDNKDEKNKENMIYTLDKSGKLSAEDIILGQIKIGINFVVKDAVNKFNSLFRMYNDNMGQYYIFANLVFHEYNKGEIELKNPTKLLFDRNRALNLTLVHRTSEDLHFLVKEGSVMRSMIFDIVEYHEPNACLQIDTSEYALGGERTFSMQGFMSSQVLSLKICPVLSNNIHQPHLEVEFSMFSLPFANNDAVTQMKIDLEKAISAFNNSIKEAPGGARDRESLKLFLEGGIGFRAKDDLLRFIPSDYCITGAKLDFDVTTGDVVRGREKSDAVRIMRATIRITVTYQPRQNQTE